MVRRREIGLEVEKLDNGTYKAEEAPALSFNHDRSSYMPSRLEQSAIFWFQELCINWDIRRPISRESLDELITYSALGNGNISAPWSRGVLILSKFQNRKYLALVNIFQMPSGDGNFCDNASNRFRTFLIPTPVLSILSILSASYTYSHPSKRASWPFVFGRFITLSDQSNNYRNRKPVSGN